MSVMDECTNSRKTCPIYIYIYMEHVDTVLTNVVNISVCCLV